MIVSDILKKSLDTLGKDKILDAELLLCHVLGVDKAHLIINMDREIDEAFVSLFFDYVDRVAAGEPVAYILGEKEFYGLNFYVDKRVLVPRPETEQIVERAVAHLRGQIDRRQMKVLDVGTGSGCIAVSIARSTNNMPVVLDACDISEDALDVTRMNVAQHSVEDKVEVFYSDLMESITNDEKYDIIVTNLPYIGEKTNRFVEKNVEDFEPSLALFGGETGLELYEKMFLQIVDKNIGFDLMLGEFGFAQTECMGSLLERYFPTKWKIVKDLAGIDRVFIVE